MFTHTNPTSEKLMRGCPPLSNVTLINRWRSSPYTAWYYNAALQFTKKSRGIGWWVASG